MKKMFEKGIFKIRISLIEKRQSEDDAQKGHTDIYCTFSAYLAQRGVHCICQHSGQDLNILVPYFAIICCYIHTFSEFRPNLTLTLANDELGSK